MKIQLKRSDRLENDVAKQPTPAQMEYGELAVNFNFSDPSIFIKDNANNIIKIAGNDAFGTANTLQEVTDQGNYTTTDVEIGGVPTASGGTPNIDLDASGNISIVGAYTGSSITTTGQGEFGNIVTGGTLEVGAADDPQSVTIAGTLSVTGDTTLEDVTVDTITVNTSSSITGSLSVTDLTVTDTAVVQGGATLGNNGIDGSGKVDVLGDLNVTQGQLNVTNDAEIAGDCDVTGVLNTGSINSLGSIACTILTTSTSATLRGDQPLTIKTPLTDDTAAVKFQNNSAVASGTVWKLLANGQSEQQGLATFKAGITANGVTTIDTANITTYNLAALPALP